MKINFDLTERQSKALGYLTDEETRYILYGGAKGGGKSWLLCLWALVYSKYLCDKFGLQPSATPLPLGFLGRKQANDFKKTTLETWKKVIPPSVYEIKKQDSEIVLFNGACKLFFGGLDSTETINKFNSAELAFFGIDQAEETTRDDVSVLRGSLRLTYNKVEPTYKELYTANPSDCWLKEDFVDRKQDHYVYIPALPADNPHLPDSYITTLEEAFKYSPPLLRAYREGDWSALKSSNMLLSSEDLKSLIGVHVAYPHPKKVIAIDPATSYDECPIYFMDNYEIKDQMILAGETDTMKIAGRVVAFARKHGVYDIGGDCIGLGEGIFDRIEELGMFTMHRINSANKSAVSERFVNMRAQIYWNLMQKILDKQIAYPVDEELRRQLINISYEVIDSSGRIRITKKDKIKQVIGRSPDRADCFAYAVYISDVAEPWVNNTKDRYEFDSVSLEFNPATV